MKPSGNPRRSSGAEDAAKLGGKGGKPRRKGSVHVGKGNLDFEYGLEFEQGTSNRIRTFLTNNFHLENEPRNKNK
jgi:hypothetical protein